MMERDTSSIVWEFVPRGKSVPRMLKWLIKLPIQRVHVDASSIVFEGARVYDSYPDRDSKGRHVFKERKVEQRGEPIPFGDIEQAAVYPIRSIQGGSDVPTSRDVAVDLWRRNDARTVATFSRYGLPSVADELALVAVIRDRIGIGWIEPPTGNVFSTLDEKRLTEWREQQ